MLDYRTDLDFLHSSIKKTALCLWLAIRCGFREGLTSRLTRPARTYGLAVSCVGLTRSRTFRRAPEFCRFAVHGTIRADAWLSACLPKTYCFWRLSSFKIQV